MAYNWKKKRNYWKYKKPDGSVQYVITIEGQKIEVTKAVFTAYSRLDRRERYLEEQDEGRLMPLGQISTKGIEEALIEITERNVRETMLLRLPLAISKLDEQEKYLLRALYMESRTERDLAREMGVAQPSIHKRRTQILKKLRIIMEIL